MNKTNFYGGSGFRSMILSGIVAGSIGFALSDELTPSTGTDGAGRSQMGRRDTSQQNSQYQGESGFGGAGKGEAEKNMGSAMQLPPNVTPGWKIRVCSEKTQASMINFKISSADKGTTSMKNGYGTGGSGATGDSMGSPSDKTQAAGTSMPMMQTAMWSQGEPTEITLPAELQTAEKIKLEAMPGEKNKEVSACVLYNDHVAKKLKFDSKNVSTVKKTETGECGC
jgi:hypothetical protein